MPSAEKITAALALWPNATVDDLASRAFGLGPGQGNDGSLNSLNSSGQSEPESRATSLSHGLKKPKLEEGAEAEQLSSAWLDLFKQAVSATCTCSNLCPLLQVQDAPPSVPTAVQAKPCTPVRGPHRKRHGEPGGHLRSSESVLSQLRAQRGGEPVAELEELEQFAQNFKRQRIRHGKRSV